MKAQRARDDKKKWQDILFAALLLGGVLFAVWKVRYGFGSNDEPFYQTIPHRLLMGDALFKDEWHLSLMSSFLLLPFTAVYTFFAGSTDGIVLAARIFYIVIHCAATVLLYSRLRKYGVLSVIACALYHLYTPYNIMALNYDSMGVELVLLAGVLLATADYQKKLWMILSGLCFGGAVLCCPFLLGVYLLYALCMGAHCLLRKRGNTTLNSELFSPRTFFLFTLGAAAIGTAFLLFTLPRVGVSGLFENLRYMLADPEHRNGGFGSRVEIYFKAIFFLKPHFKYAIYSYCAMALVPTALCMCLSRRRS